MKGCAYKILPLYLALSFASTNILAADCESSGTICTSADITPTSKTNTVLCPQIKIGTNDASPKTLAAGPNVSNIPSKYTHDCESGIDGGGVGWGGAFFIIVIAGAFTPSCPPDKPFLNAIDEGWGGVFIGFAGGGGAGMTVTCCAMPEDPGMSMESGYKPGSYDHWAVGSCPNTSPTP